MAIVTFGGCLRGPEIVELVGHAGYDGVFIDMEHMAHDLRDVQTMVLAAERMGITRSSGRRASTLPWSCAPRSGRPGDPRASRLDSRGRPGSRRRGAIHAAGRARAHRLQPGGRLRADPLGRHIEQSNREVLLAVMIEDRQGVEEIEAIAAVPGIDLIAPGPNDLAGALERAGAAGPSEARGGHGSDRDRGEEGRRTASGLAARPSGLSADGGRVPGARRRSPALRHGAGGAPSPRHVTGGGRCPSRHRGRLGGECAREAGEDRGVMEEGSEAMALTGRGQ